MKRTLIHHAIIVNEGRTFHGSVLIEDDLIKDIIEGEEKPSVPCDTEIDAAGNFLLPGIIDDHVHFRDPGLTHKADMQSETQAAAAGGVTSFMDMPNCNPQTTSLEALDNKFVDAAGKCLVNYSFYFGATNNNADLISSLDRTHVCGVKLFMGASTGNMLVDRMAALRTIFSNVKGMLIATHCEDQPTIRENTESFKAKYGEDPEIRFHPLIRSEEACWRSSSLAVQLARETGARLHILHISTVRELQLFEDKPLSEKQITAEACVSHLMFSDEDYATLGARIKCNPSIKTRSDRDALRMALRTNRIDVIGTDHAPHLITEKNGGALKAVSGMPTLQFSLNSIMELVKEGVITIEQLVQKMCHAPAQLFQISKRGYIRKGYKADMVILNPNVEWKVTSDCILSKCGWSPMEGRTFHTKVEKTFVNGRIVYSSEKGVDTSVRGEALVFDR